MMKTKKRKLKPSSSCSNPAEESAVTESILALGKKLVAELKLEKSVDTLGRWMAHYIAEKIADAEEADDETRERKRSECCDAILKLWSHRRDFDQAYRPLKSFEPIFRTLENLGAADSVNRYFGKNFFGNEELATSEWLQSAVDADESARYVISFCLKMAAKSALGEEQDWIQVASEISQDDDDFKVISKLTIEEGYLAEYELEMIGKLEKLSSVCLDVIDELRKGKSLPVRKLKTKRLSKKIRGTPSDQ